MNFSTITFLGVISVALVAVGAEPVHSCSNLTQTGDLITVSIVINTAENPEVKELEGTAMLRTTKLMNRRFPELKSGATYSCRVIENRKDLEGIYYYTTEISEKDVHDAIAAWRIACEEERQRKIREEQERLRQEALAKKHEEERLCREAEEHARIERERRERAEYEARQRELAERKARREAEIAAKEAAEEAAVKAAGDAVRKANAENARKRAEEKARKLKAKPAKKETSAPIKRLEKRIDMKPALDEDEVIRRALEDSL